VNEAQAWQAERKAGIKFKLDKVLMTPSTTQAAGKWIP